MYKIKSSIITVLTLIFFTATANVYAGGKNQIDDNAGLSVSEIESLLFMREEEKMARDVYLTLYDLWNEEIFNNIASSEQEHMDAIKSLLDKYDLVDPVIDSIGVFSDPELQELYIKLVERGEKSAMEALHVGGLIEEVDMQDIKEAIDEAEHEDIIAVYEELLKGSRNHLRSFVGKIEDEGIVYEAQVLSQEEVDEIVDSPIERGSI
ncbi:MAG: DUF2202 domain-containing protein [Methylomarinum sp.]|nr:DUF2202 domain-containing protein [Methylomarinum sp.]